MSKKLEGKTRTRHRRSRGIGAAIAKRLAADGASVAITYTKGADAAASVVKEIESAGGKAIAIQADATDRQGRAGRGRQDRRTLRQARRAGEQCRHRDSQAVRGDHAGGNGSA